ncbi:hypothetical protein MMC11_005008 [Xylographa trunciseda]|nr:hypothetical protein [Xylographa trunciseda]
MAPTATAAVESASASPTFGLTLPDSAAKRLVKAGIDPTSYPTRPQKPEYLDQVYAIRSEYREHVDPGQRADRAKRSLLGAASRVVHLTAHIGTELHGLQLAALTDAQKDELALLVAERSVVFLRDQDISPQQQRALGAYFGTVEVHPQVPQVPGVPGVTVMWPDLQIREGLRPASFRQPGGAARWHTDLVHEAQPAGITHLHNDTVPETGGDTLWSSGYSAYDKLSPDFRKFVDGKRAVYRSAHRYVDRDDPAAGPKFVEREHPLVRVHPATGWKSLWVNRAMTVRIVGLDPAESGTVTLRSPGGVLRNGAEPRVLDLILNYLYDVYERNVDIQVRFKWSPGASALWDNRITQHIASWDYEGNEPRHGTRVTSLAEKPFFDAEAPSRREALGLDK